MTDPIRIFVGCSANNEDLESQAVLDYTLHKYASQDLEIVWMMQSRDPQSFWSGWNTAGWATPFSGFRWGVPEYCGYKGRAIYLDSDMIVMDDIAKLWNTPITKPHAVIAKGSNERFCCTLFDCAAVKKFLLPFKQLKTVAGSHRNQRLRLAKSGAVQSFPEDENWNCCDGENYASLEDPRIKIHHYTAIDCQPQLKYAIPRLAKAGQVHWFKGQVKPHWRTDIEPFFDMYLKRANRAGYRPSKYKVEPFGDYAAGGSAGGAWVKGRPAKAMGR